MVKGYSEVLIKEFTFLLNRELTMEELHFFRWLEFKLRSETVRKRKNKK